jgi:TolA-binding protein
VTEQTLDPQVAPPQEGGDPSGPEPAGSAASAPPGATPAPQEGAGTGGEGQTSPEPESEEIRSLRRESQSLRRRLREAEAKVSEHEQAQLSEQEKVARERDEAAAEAERLRSAIKESNLRSEVVAQAAKLGFKNPQIAARALEPDSIEWEEDRPTNIGALLQDLARQEPYLLGSAGAPSGGSPANPGGSGSEEAPPETYEQQMRRLYGSGGGIWANPEAQGGGVVWPPPGAAG